MIKINSVKKVAEQTGLFSKVHISPQQVKTSNSKLAPLEADTVQLSKNINRWTGPAEDYLPTTFNGSQVSMHHDLNGTNCQFRNVLKMIEENTLATKKTGRIMAENYLPVIREVDKEFAKLPPLEKDCIVYRGRVEHPVFKSSNKDFEIIEKAKVGDKIIPDTAYSYTAFDRYLAEHWGIPASESSKSIMYTIRLPQGAKVSRNLEHGGEVVIPRGAEYKVVSKEVNGNHTEITLEYILPEKDNVAEIEKIMEDNNIKFDDTSKYFED